MIRAEVSILVLAAGASRRMGGRDKLLELVDGIPLLRAQALKALAVSGSVHVALPVGHGPRKAVLKGLAVKAVQIMDHAKGMGVTLCEAVTALPAERPIMVLLGDVPEITARDLRSVATAVEAEPDADVWRAVTETGVPGNPVVFTPALRPKLLGLTGDDGARGVVASAGRVVDVPLPGSRARLDLDTQAAWADWRAVTGR